MASKKATHAPRAATKKSAAKGRSTPKTSAKQTATPNPNTPRKGAKKSENARTPASHMKSAPPAQVAERLALAVPKAQCELNHQNAFELLVATILSAQSTDKMVNTVTPELFRRWPTPEALADAPQEEVEEVIKRTGFFRNKAKSIRGAAAKLVQEHGGEVPKSLDALIALPGVARKTANVVLGTAYGIASGFVVDTHVMRVSQRLGLTQHKEPAKIELDLCEHFPREHWVDLGHRILLHGRYTCLAKAPMCEHCPLNELCPSRLKEPLDSWEERAREEAARVDAGFRAGAVVNV